MKSILRHIRIYFILAALFLKQRAQYEIDFFIAMLGIFMNMFAGVATTWLIFNSVRDLGGWTYYEMLFFIGFFQFATLPYLLFFQPFWGLSSQLQSGDFIRYYFRPLNMMFYYVSNSFDLRGTLVFIIGSFVIMIFAGAHLVIAWSLPTILLLFVNWISSSLIIISILVGGMSTSFWIINSGPLTVVLSNIRDNARFPLNIFDKVFQFIFTFIIPIGFIAFYPCLMLLRPIEQVPLQAWFSPVVGLILFFLVYQLWKKGINHYSGTGS